MAELRNERAEQPQTRTERLLYHGTTGAGTAGLIAEHGLLADKVTLTPVLELAMDYARGGTLTVWYPKRAEHSGAGSLGPSQPTTPLADEQRAEIKAKIEQRDIDEEVKNAYLAIVDRANTILPNSRLGAIITPGSSMDWVKLSSYSFSSRMDGYLQKYTTDREAMVREREALLRNAKDVTMIDPNLTAQQLADDMVRTEVEHYLLNIGYLLKLANNRESGVGSDQRFELDSYLHELQAVHFPEPTYEKYREMLVTSITSAL